MENQLQTKQDKSSFLAMTKKNAIPLSLLAVALASGNANAAEFTLDMSQLITMIGVVAASVTAVGLAAMSITLTVKAFRYVKSAF